MKPVNGSSTPILRGTWFKKTTSLDHWEPLDENDAGQIEKAHQGVIRSLVNTCGVFQHIFSKVVFCG